MVFILLFTIALGLFIIERIWPANELPKVQAWWTRVIFVNFCQFLIVILAGITWDSWLGQVSLIKLSTYFSTLSQAIIAYLCSTFVYYWWHRYRHQSRLFWLLCHQLHHSPRRIELVTSFYKHPLEITLNSIISAVLVYGVFGCSVEAGAIYTILTALAEFFYHLNIRTPYALGYVIQRPEAHRIHHQHLRHTQNFADLPIWDMLFGTFTNPKPGSPSAKVSCGFLDWQEHRFEDMLGFRNVLAPGYEAQEPLKLLPTCFGCRKRWACSGDMTISDLSMTKGTDES